MSIALAAATAVLAVVFIASGRSAGTGKGAGRLASFHSSGAGGGKRRRFGDGLWKILALPTRALPKSWRVRLSCDLEERAGHCGLSVEQLLGMRLLVSTCLPPAVLLLLRFSTLGFVLLVPCVFLGVAAPRAVAGRGLALHMESLKRALPHTADILYALVLGGKNLDQAFRGAADGSPEPLGPILRQSVREMELGASRDEAFERLISRHPLPELASLLRSLLLAERKGHPLSETLGVFSREIRLRRRDELRVAVAKAPLKMLAPLVLLILPASVILTVGPTFLAALGRGL